MGEKARREAEEKAKKEAKEKTRREAEEKAKREATEKARKEVEENTKKDMEEKAKCEAEEKGRKEVEVKARREAEEKAKHEATEKAMKEAEVKQSEWEKCLEKSYHEWQHKEAQHKCNDQASTASSSCTTDRDDLMRELPMLEVSKLQMLLQKLQHAREGGEIAQLVHEAVAEHNKTMPGWEVPVPSEV